MFPLHDTIDDTTRKNLSAYDDLTAALLARRGITDPDAAHAFLNPSYDEHLHDPLQMRDMQKAATRLARAIAQGEHIAVWSDYDADGIPGGVILHDFLRKVGADFENYIPHRHFEGYGVNTDGIEKLAERGTALVITVDSGITDLPAVARAKERGMDVIVTDHHEPGATLPDAFAVVDPKRTDETYPFRELCGAGLAWKLVVATLAVDPTLREHLPEGTEKWLLDMAGLSTIADMVPLVGENRVLARYGLLVLRKSPRLGLHKLLRAMRTDQRTLTEDDIGFMIAPRINAASRMGDAYDAFHLLSTRDENEADSLAKKLESLNRKRKAEAGAITRAVHARLKEREQVRSVIAMGDPEWRPALLGLVAGNIADEYERPVFLWGREGSGVLKGSMRSAGNIHGLALMRAAENVFSHCGGHAAAGGFSVKDDAVFFLEDALVDALETLPRETDDELVAHADALVGLEDITDAFLAKINHLAPFGMGNPKPLFLIPDAPVAAVSRFGKGKEHVKITFTKPNSSRTIDAIAFFAKGALARTADALEPGAALNVLAHIERDSFSRGNPIRLRIVDLRSASATL